MPGTDQHHDATDPLPHDPSSRNVTHSIEPAIDRSAGNASQQRLSFTMLIAVPVLVSAFFSLRDSDQPPLSISENRPSLVFDSYLVYEGPEPTDPQPLKVATFRFVNKGPGEVRITKLVPSCGCLTPEVSRSIVPSGSDGYVTLPVRTGNEPSGPRDYIVTVMYEDTQPREVALTYSVVLPEKQIVVEPKVLMLMGNISSSVTQPIAVTDYRPERRQSPLRILDVLNSSTLFTAEVEGYSADDDAGRTMLRVRFADFPPRGQHRGLITLLTDDEDFPVIQIPVVLGDRRRPVNEPVRVVPESARVILQTNSPETSVGTTVRFEIPSRWHVSHVDVFPSELSARIQSSTAVTDDVTAVSVSVDVTGIPVAGMELGSLTLHANDTQHSAEAAADDAAPDGKLSGTLTDAEMVTIPLSLIRR